MGTACEARRGRRAQPRAPRSRQSTSFPPGAPSPAHRFRPGFESRRRRGRRRHRNRKTERASSHHTDKSTSPTLALPRRRIQAASPSQSILPFPKSSPTLSYFSLTPCSPGLAHMQSGQRPQQSRQCVAARPISVAASDTKFQFTDQHRTRTDPVRFHTRISILSSALSLLGIEIRPRDRISPHCRIHRLVRSPVRIHPLHRHDPSEHGRRGTSRTKVSVEPQRRLRFL